MIAHTGSITLESSDKVISMTRSTRHLVLICTGCTMFSVFGLLGATT